MKCSIKIDSELNTDILIVAKLSGKSKERLIEEILKEGIKPYLDSVVRQRFK